MSDWRARRDALINEYLQRADGNGAAALQMINDAIRGTLDGETLLSLLEAEQTLKARLDPTGTVLVPSDQGKACPGNGEHPGIERCCDECDFYLDCFSQYS